MRLDAAFDKFLKLIPKAKRLASNVNDEEKLKQLLEIAETTRGNFYEAISHEINRVGQEVTNDSLNVDQNRSSEISYKLPATTYIDTHI